MKCLEPGMLQAHIDGELDISLKKEIDRHLLECEKCSSRYNELKLNDDFSFEKISAYRQYLKDNTNILNRSHVSENNQFEGFTLRKGVIKHMVKYKKIAAIACSLLIVSTALTVQPVRAALTNALSIFRVENVKGIKISLEEIQKIQSQLSQNQKEINMDTMGKIKTTGGEQRGISLDEARNLPDIHLKLPSELSSLVPQINTVDSSVMEFTLSVDNINEALRLFGGTKMFPEELDGKTFTVKFPRQVDLYYKLSDGRGLNITQSKSPIIEVPEGCNVDELYESLVDLPVFPSRLQSQLKSIKDWKNTLYLPMVESETEEAIINGSTGYLYSKEPSGSSTEHCVLIWSSEGVIYTASGNVGKEEILNLARSMR